MFRGRAYRLYFVGIGGIGMSGIAEVLLNLGYQVHGSDLCTTAVTRRWVPENEPILPELSYPSGIGGKRKETHHEPQVVAHLGRSGGRTARAAPGDCAGPARGGKAFRSLASAGNSSWCSNALLARNT